MNKLVARQMTTAVLYTEYWIVHYNKQIFHKTDVYRLITIVVIIIVTCATVRIIRPCPHFSSSILLITVRYWQKCSFYFLFIFRLGFSAVTEYSPPCPRGLFLKETWIPFEDCLLLQLYHSVLWFFLILHCGIHCSEVLLLRFFLSFYLRSRPWTVATYKVLSTVVSWS